MVTWLPSVLVLSLIHIFSIAVVQTEEKQGAEILDYVKNCTGKQKNTYCYCLDSEDVSEAHALGLSYGRYRWYKEITKYDPQITPEELNQMLSLIHISLKKAALIQAKSPQQC